MLVLALRGIDDIDESELLEKLSQAGGQLRLLVRVPNLASSPSRWAIAQARLAVWYIAEMLEQYGRDVEVDESDDDEDGDVEVAFEAVITDVRGLVPKLCWLAPAFDPETEDDGTAMFDLTCEMEGWLEERGNAPARFPKLQKDYEADAAAARAYESDDDDDTK